MRAFLSIKYQPDQSNRPKIETIAKALEKAGHDTVCVVRDVEHWGRTAYTASDLMTLTFAEIDRCNLFVIDVTEKGVGVGIEAGYAYARGKPIWVIAPSDIDISNTLMGILDHLTYYDRLEDLDFALFQ